MSRESASSGPFHAAKLLSWSIFVIILGTNLVLAVFLADYARRSLLEKQEQYALLLAENLNHQIFQRFTLPTVMGFGEIDLDDERQYEQLEKVVKTTIHSFNVLDLRIYGFQRDVAFSLDEGEVGDLEMAGQSVERALEEGQNSYELVSRYSSWTALFAFDFKPQSVILRTVYSLRADRRMDPADPRGPITGALEITQDITEDYRKVINLERLIILSSTVTSLALFFVIIVVLRRADRMAAERAREKEQLERELMQSEKLASMGRMVAGVAHEIRNPLGIIRSSAELLLSKLKREENPDSANVRILQAIFDESKRLSRTVGDFLDYARPRQPRQDPVDLSRVLNQVAVFLESTARERGVTLETDLDEGLTVQGDSDLLYRAFYNLVANSLDALAELDGGGQEHTITVAAHGAEDGVSVVVRDTGPGFPDEVLEQAKDPFFTTKEHGTGLGLAITDTILQSHGASLDLENDYEGGARATVVFPGA
ncbi:sensor histidine kinase [Desulfohalovibrio reitneri]|uniref:sensor histidine kinase n=1 Tax=Desulfohalovibrio reitneri TaxID=1307759 RepID=UPI0004A740BA|nr:ATP-binding protein [Desulfohalovibrio reitneri]